MRIAIVSDIHGNLTALEAVLADLKVTSPDQILHGGDLAHGGSRPAETVDRIRELGWPGVCGNTDQMLWAPEELRKFAAQAPKLHARPIALVHASPGDLWRAPIADASDEELGSVFAALTSTVAVYGHIHRPFVRQLPAMTVANTGSVSLSYDGDVRASYLILDDTKASIRRVVYEVEREAQALMRSGLPHADWLCRSLRAGRYVPPA
jgi:putative phosphoesterase